MRYLISYILAAIIFLAIDSQWIGNFATEFYQEKIGHLMADTFDLKGAAAFYLIYIAGIVFFAVRPALKETARKPALKTALICGGLYGFFTYATYDLTNYATLRDWPFDMVVIDLIWGTVLTAIVATIVTWVMRKFEWV